MTNRHPSIRAVAFDLDGTLLHPDKTISPYTLETINLVKELGIIPIIATGRSRESLEPFRRQLDLATPVVCYNGACVMDPFSGSEIVHHTIGHSICREIVRLSRYYKLPLHVYQDHMLYFESMSRTANSYETLSRASSKEVDFDEMDDLHFTKAMYIGSVGVIEQIRGELEALFPGKLSKVYTYLDYFEIMHHRANKRYALEDLFSGMDITRDSVMAFGDGENDLEMIAWAEYGYTMGNALPSVLKHAVRVAPMNTEDGVAHTIRNLLGIPFQ